MINQDLLPIFLKEGRLTKKSSAYFRVSTAQTDSVNTRVIDGLEYSTIQSDATPRHWGYLSLVDPVTKKPLPFESEQVQRLFRRCTATEQIDPRTGNSVTRYVGDNQLIKGFVLDTSQPILKQDGSPTGGFWVSVAPEQAPARPLKTAKLPVLQAYAKYHNVAFKGVLKGDLVKALVAKGLL